MQARVPTPAKEAQAATAGSRPTSQEVASLIEGFEDDFHVSNKFPPSWTAVMPYAAR